MAENTIIPTDNDALVMTALNTLSFEKRPLPAEPRPHEYGRLMNNENSSPKLTKE